MSDSVGIPFLSAQAVASGQGGGGCQGFALSQWGLDRLDSATVEAPRPSMNQDERAIGFLKNTIVDRIQERSLHAFFVQKDILSRHPKVHRWPIFVQQFVAGPLANLIAMAELHKTVELFSAARGHALADRLLWSTHLRCVGLQRNKLINMLPNLVSDLKECADHLGFEMSGGNGRLAPFLHQLHELHVAIMDASLQMLKLYKEDPMRGGSIFIESAQKLDQVFPSRDANGETYVWPAIWLTPSESSIESAIKLRMKPSPLSVDSSLALHSDIGKSTQSAHAAKVIKCAKGEPVKPSPVTSAREKLAQEKKPKPALSKMSSYFSPSVSYSSEIDVSRYSLFPSSIQSPADMKAIATLPGVRKAEAVSDSAIVESMLCSLEKSDGERFFYLNKDGRSKGGKGAGKGWDRVRLSWSNAKGGKEASLFMFKSKAGQVLTMTKRQLSTLISQRKFKEFLHTIPAMFGKDDR